jgi:ATP-dependent DNA helicase RecQ
MSETESLVSKFHPNCTLGFKATYYHGGLTSREKDKTCSFGWTIAQVIVATNAFGMGIDKADVKTVIHIQLPENIENYYQEAGRSGRNGEKAFAVLLTNPSDIKQAENQFIHILPDKKFSTRCTINSVIFSNCLWRRDQRKILLNLNHFV